MTDYEPLAALSDIHAKRGYLLSHHGLMAISAPHLPERYDSLYSTLALSIPLLHLKKDISAVTPTSLSG